MPGHSGTLAQEVAVLKRAALSVAVALGALCAGAAAASAHPLLVTSAPAPGAIVPGSPSTVALQFSESAVPSGSRLKLSGPHGQVKLGPLTASDGGQQLSAKLGGKLEPGVYRARWLALGDDGHTVSGTFAFGVAERNGDPPPGAAASLGAVGTAGRGGDGSSPGPVSVAALWLGVLAASLLWGGWLLTAVIRRRGVVVGPGIERLRRAGEAALALAAIATLYGLIAQARAGAGGGFDFGLLTASGTGLSVLIRAAIAVLGAAVVAVGLRRQATERRVLAGGVVGALLLVCFGLSGHVIAQGSAWAAASMGVHVLAAGTWVGALIALVLLTPAVPLKAAARAFAPIAAGAVGIVAVTGAIAAFREVSHWYFLFWSGYGRLVIVKVAVVALAAGLGTVGALKARRRLVVAETTVLVVVVAIAGVLSGLAQGRGQPLPAQQGDLLAGPAITTVLVHGGLSPISLAPSRPGLNRIAIQTASATTSSVVVRMVCGCDARPIISRLSPGQDAPGTFSATVLVPAAGTWNAYVTVDGRRSLSPAALPVGVQSAPGAPAHDVLAVADLSGPGADRCRRFLIGAELAIGRLNGAGGVDGGQKVSLLAYDDRASEAQGAADAQTTLGWSGPARPLALLPCGAGSEAAIGEAARAGVPTIAGDPATDPVPGSRVFRLAADPYADGVATGQAINTEVTPVSTRTAHTVLAVTVNDDQGRRRLAGLKAALAARRPDLRVRVVPERVIVHGSGQALLGLLNRLHTVALALDGTDAQAPALAAAFRRLPATAKVFEPAPVFASERLLSEGLIERSGDAGEVGVVQGTSTVEVDSRDGLTLSQALPALFPGESASLESLRGYVTGLALDYALDGGTSSAPLAARLERPAPFTDAIAEPWRSNDPAAGASELGVLEPNFMSTTLLPSNAGGENHTGLYFPSGAWERPVTNTFGLPPQDPLPPLGGVPVASAGANG
jgi:methionine-rich copper-binding protein CopC/putative copper export protein